MKPFTIYPVVPQLKGLLVATHMESPEGVCMFKGMITHQFRRSLLHINSSSSVIGGARNKAAARDEAGRTVFEKAATFSGGDPITVLGGPPR